MKWMLNFTFYEKISKCKPNWTTFLKEVFDSSISLENDKITALWPKYSLTFTFYETFSNGIPNSAIFVKEAFLFDY